MKNIIIFGPPGTGKGTVSKKLAEEYGFKHISTGDIIRKNQEEKTKIGVLADRLVNDGKFLPDNIINEMVKQEVINDTNSPGFVFDGFPRNTSQAKMIDQLLNYKKMPLKVIHLESSKNVVLNRILERGKEGGRKDDNEDVFKKRWSEYKTQTLPALGYFQGRGVVSKVNGEQTPEEVYGEVKTIIEEW